MAKIGEKEAQRRAMREAAAGPAYHSLSSRVLPVKVMECVPSTSAAVVPERRENELDESLAKRSVLIKGIGAPKRKRAPAGTFDRKTYQRELMRKRRAAAKAMA